MSEVLTKPLLKIRFFWALDAASLGEWFPTFRRFKQSSRTSSYRYAHSQLMVGGNILCLYLYQCISSHQRSGCRRLVLKSTRVFFQIISESMRLLPHLYAFAVFEHVRSKTKCVRLPHERLVRKPHPNPWPWPYLALSVTVHWAKHVRTLSWAWT